MTRPAPAVRRRPFQSAIGAVVGLFVTLIGLIVLAWAILFVTKGRFLKPTFVKYASKYADRAVAVDGDFQFYFNPFHLKFLAQGLTLANPAWAPRQAAVHRPADRYRDQYVGPDFRPPARAVPDARRRQRGAGDRQGGAQHVDLRRRYAVQGAADRPRQCHRQRAALPRRQAQGRRPPDVRRPCRQRQRARRGASRRPADLSRRRHGARRRVHAARCIDDAELDDRRGQDGARSPRQRRADGDRRQRHAARRRQDRRSRSQRHDRRPEPPDAVQADRRDRSGDAAVQAGGAFHKDRRRL